MAFISGKGGSATCKTNPYKIKSWRLQRQGGIPDVTNGESGGEGEYISGVNDTTWEIELDYYTGHSPFASGEFEAGAIIAMELLHTAAGTKWAFTGIVESCEEVLEVRGVATVHLRGKVASGTPSAPTT